MKKKRIAIIFIFVAFVCLFIGCNNNEIDEYGNVTVTFKLEGGKYKSSTYDLKYKYNLENEEAKMKIQDPSSLMTSTYKIENPGFELVGWYRNREENNGVVTYSGLWDFDNDKIGIEGITLYAKWQAKKVYSYDLYFIDENGNEQFLVNKVVNEGSRLLDDYAEDALDGYTFIKYLNEDGSPWNKEFTHPGGDQDTKVKALVQCIKGNFKVVRTKLELTSAIKNARNNIYLDADIDMEGDKVFFKNYQGTLIGNNHKISNFSLNPTPYGNLKESLEDNVLYVSLFGDIENAKIENVTFENVTLNLDAGLSIIRQIYLLPLAKKMTNSTICNVTFNGTYEVASYPSDTFDKEENFIVSNLEYLEKDEESVNSSNKIEFNEIENVEKEN